MSQLSSPTRDQREAEREAAAAHRQEEEEPEAAALEPGFNIQAVVRLTGVPAETLRAWERRYGMPSPRRAPNAQRVYSLNDIEVVRWLRNQTEHGLTAKRAVEQLLKNPEAARLPKMESFEPHELVDQLVEAALRFDVTATEQALSHALAAHPLDTVVLQIVAPTLVEIGERWHRGEITPAVEHFSTALIRRRLEQIASLLDSGAGRPLIVVGAAPDELHDVGALVFSILLRRRGIHVIFLGQSVSLDAAIDITRRLKPDLFCLSAASPPTAKALAGIGRALAEMGPAAPTFAFGGQAFVSAPDLIAQSAGTYLGADTAAAVAEAERLARASSER